MTLAQLAVNVPSVAGVFDYAIPEGLEARVGQLVTVPFGPRTAQGVILRFVDSSPAEHIKRIIAALDPEPVVFPAQIALAEALAEATLSPVAAIIEMMLPPGLGQQGDTLFELREVQDSFGQHSTIAARLLKLLQERGPLRGRQIDRHFGPVDWRAEARRLARQGVLTSQPVLPTAAIRPKFIRTAQLGAAPEEAEAAMPGLGKTAATLSRRQAALRFLMHAREAVNVSWVYAESGSNLADLQELAERDLILLRETEIWRDPVKRTENRGGDNRGTENSIAPVLTTDQERVWIAIQAAFGEAGSPPFLLHGVTGSGKTEIYLRCAEEALRRGKQAILLVPEIALTAQTVQRFLRRFPGQVGLVHSQLSEGERYDTWRRARAGLLKVIIGPRSALFAPLPEIGFIGVGALILVAIWAHAVWFGILCVFILLNCWGGLMQARVLARVAKLPRRSGFACPSCRQAPIIGPLWRCDKCQQAFDTFETHATCPHCGALFPVTRCPECGQAHSLAEWAAAAPTQGPPRL